VDANFFFELELVAGVPQQTIQVDIVGGYPVVNPAKYPIVPGQVVYWACSEPSLSVDFSQSPHNPKSPFLDPATKNGPLDVVPNEPGSFITIGEQVGNMVDTFPYIVSVGTGAARNSVNAQFVVS
jgi:hypothetical protein